MNTFLELLHQAHLAHLIKTQLIFILPAVIIAFGVGLIGFPFFIDFLKSLRVQQFIREESPDSHQSKKGTPTGGGIFLIGLWVLVSLIMAGVMQFIKNAEHILPSPYFYTPLIISLGLMGLGMWDDLAKVLKKQNKGLGARAKLVVQAGIGVMFGLIMVFVLGDTDVHFSSHIVHLNAWQYILYATFAVTALSNAVNLTDGLDSLAGSTTALTFYAFSLLLLTLPHAEKFFPTLLLCLLILPCLIAFLVYNKFPARVFMGDSGSLALGGLIASVGLMTHQDGWLLLTAGIFTLEALSVVIQIVGFQLWQKRIFKMAPFHHHFELCGWHETQVVQAFVVFHGLLCMLALYLQRFNGVPS
jgi:phospho-N-acetylmuramoyl-pentapeptide-transferase